jgi:hypothetical protein
MNLVLCCVSSQGTWLLESPKFDQGFVSVSWSDNESSEISQGLSSNLDQLLLKANCDLSQINEFYGVTGPGAFTGLRITGSYLMGLARSLNKPVYGIPSSFLNNEKDFWIPLQHQKVKKLTLSEAVEFGVEFLKVSGLGNHEISVPSNDDTVWGLKDFPLWPEPQQLFSALQLALKKNKSQFEITYGSEPKIFGKRN